MTATYAPCSQMERGTLILRKAAIFHFLPCQSPALPLHKNGAEVNLNPDDQRERNVGEAKQPIDGGRSDSEKEFVCGVMGVFVNAGAYSCICVCDSNTEAGT